MMLPTLMRRRRPSAPILALLVASATLLAVGTGVFASTSGGSSEGGSTPTSSPSEPKRDEGQELFDRGLQLVKEGNFEGARERFEKAVSKRKNDPDFLNMLAYTQRKTGNLEDAFENYEKALGQRPKFPQAREYLGEAHLQAALLQVEVLRGYGPEGKKELDVLAAAFARAAETLKAEAMGAGTAAAVDPKAW